MPETEEPRLDEADLPAPSPCNLPKQAVYDFAESVASELGLEPGHKLLPVVEALGGSIVRRDISEDFDGSIVVRRLGSFQIVLSDDVGPLRNRFTIGHELGHYFLHAPQTDFRLRAERFGTGRVEWEANWFASGLLMPSKQFHEAHKDCKGSIVAIAEVFRMSRSATEIRATTLGLDAS